MGAAMKMKMNTMRPNFNIDIAGANFKDDNLGAKFTVDSVTVKTDRFEDA